MSLTSTASKARPGTKSLRATVPEGIVAFLKLEAGDKLEWEMEIIDGERVAIIRNKNTDEAMRIASKYAKRKKE